MTIQQIVRDILARAIEDGLVEPALEDRCDDPDPQRITAADLAGCTRLLAAWLRRKGAREASS